jgi:ABC-type transporter Mla MlaB component
MDNYSISSFPNQEAEKTSLIELKGELSIQHIHEIKTELEAAIKEMDTVELLVYDASIIDLSVLQYLLSLKKSEKALNKSFKISFELDDDLDELLKHAGFKNIEKLKE